MQNRFEKGGLGDRIKKLGVDSTLGLFWKGGRGQDNIFEMLDKYDRNLDAGRPGYIYIYIIIYIYILWIFDVVWML